MPLISTRALSYKQSNLLSCCSAVTERNSLLRHTFCFTLRILVSLAYSVCLANYLSAIMIPSTCFFLFTDAFTILYCTSYFYKRKHISCFARCQLLMSYLPQLNGCIGASIRMCHHFQYDFNTKAVYMSMRSSFFLS